MHRTYFASPRRACRGARVIFSRVRRHERSTLLDIAGHAKTSSMISSTSGHLSQAEISHAQAARLHRHMAPALLRPPTRSIRSATCRAAAVLPAVLLFTRDASGARMLRKKQSEACPHGPALRDGGGGIVPCGVLSIMSHRGTVARESGPRARARGGAGYRGDVLTRRHFARQISK